MRVLLPVALAAAFLLSCASRGTALNEEWIPNIERGVTTTSDIRSWFGDPAAVEVQSGSGSIWRYLHEDETRRDSGTFTKIGRSIASIFGQQVYVPPVDVEYSNTARQQLDVYFDANGVVEDYRYERVDLPTKRVY